MWPHGPWGRLGPHGLFQDIPGNLPDIFCFSSFWTSQEFPDCALLFFVRKVALPEVFVFRYNAILLFLVQS